MPFGFVMGAERRASGNDCAARKAIGIVSSCQSSNRCCAESACGSPKTTRAIESQKRAWTLGPTAKVQLVEEGRANNASTNCPEEATAGDCLSAEEREV